MGLLALALASMIGHRPAVQPVLWLNPEGRLTVGGKAILGRLSNGAHEVRTPAGLGLDFVGGRSGFLLDDLPELRLTGSMTVAAWVYLRQYAPNGMQSQILFRGDDRIANDPYHLTVESSGKVAWGFDDRENVRTEVRAEVPLNTWVRLTGVFDSEQNQLRIYVNQRLVSTTETLRRPFSELQKEFVPGIGIGNVQNDRGPHNQPLNGMIVDLRLYDVALEPSEAGYRAIFRNAG